MRAMRSKRPLTIISADADVLDMECGENEWLRDIQLQIKRLTALTNDLIYLPNGGGSGPSANDGLFPL